MIAIAAMIELVDVEGYALPLARRLMTGALAVPVIAAALCPVALRAAFGAHTGLPSADQPTSLSMLATMATAAQGPRSPAGPAKGPAKGPETSLRTGHRHEGLLLPQAGTFDGGLPPAAGRCWKHG